MNARLLAQGCLAAVTLLLSMNLAPGADSPLASRVSEVTLYREQAMVTRVIAIDSVGPSQEVVVKDLPEQIVPESLFAEGNGGVEVRAVRFRSEATSKEPRDELRKLDESLEQIRQKLSENKKSQELLTKKTGYLDQLEGFVAPTAKTDLARGVLNAQALEEVTNFSFAQRQELKETAVAIERDAENLQKEMTLLERQRAELSKSGSHTAREAVIFVAARGDGKGSVRLSYLVRQCGWSPTYTFRGTEGNDEVHLECNGSIQQMTGEDWDGVKLTLSTASPALSASRPGLTPFPVILVPQGEQKGMGVEDLERQLDTIRQQKATAMEQSGVATDSEAKAGAVRSLNVAANQYQNLELLSGKNLLGAAPSGDEWDEGPSLSYPLANVVSVASRSDQQLVQVFRSSFKARWYFVASPVLTRHVYREAELTNTSDRDLLGGPIAVYLDDRFVGRSEIPTVARAQTFVAGFGVDPQLRARRELIDRSESLQGGNRKLDFKYRITLENWRSTEAVLRVYDRVPHADGTTDVRITLVPPTDPLDTDPVYERREKPKGVLRWQITVPSGSVRDKARLLEYSYTVEFERSYQLGTWAGGPQVEDFLKVQPAASMSAEARQPEPNQPVAPNEPPPPQTAPAPPSP